MTVFISYDFDDKALYSSLCLALDSSNIRRYDASKLSPGEALTVALRSAIEECDHCVFIATPRSLKSAWCLAELGAFWGAGERVIVYQGDPLVDESVIPPQFRGNLWTADAKDLLAGITASAAGGVRVIPNGYSVNLAGMVLNVTFGRIEECGCDDEACLVALPANEFFDDECVHDPRSALGAFMQRHFKNDVREIQELVKVALNGKLTQSVEKTPGHWANSYGTGTCIFLNRPLSSNFRIALVSVTTQRANEGLRADPSYLFSAVTGLQRTMANHRLTHAFIPLLGSGHGGLREEVSLVCMVIAFGELRRLAPNLKEVSIVIFRKSETAAPSVSDVTIKRVLDFASRFMADKAAQ